MPENYTRPVGAATLMHVALVCKDIDASLRFYREGLGFSRTYEWSESAVVPTCPHQLIFKGRALYIELNGDTYIELFEGGRDDVDSSAGPIQHIALIVPDVEEAYRNCLAAGGQAFTIDGWPGDPTTVELNGDPAVQLRVAFVKGPAGELIELYEQHGPLVAR
ncbi:VOC family protein [Streptomyces sp. H27-C3]|uniref:VOC family protein n=1 Tax=Streptomyces sp. H27-C3 TaxID=3046305 RepID=UPI0024B98807|nr:VOC family protein [Streptomyces sp. H27-C3]MDJ0466589.1 VOC family protein [Streptomyces sp. H27-C3]